MKEHKIGAGIGIAGFALACAVVVVGTKGGTLGGASDSMATIAMWGVIAGGIGAFWLIRKS